MATAASRRNRLQCNLWFWRHPCKHASSFNFASALSWSHVNEALWSHVNEALWSHVNEAVYKCISAKISEKIRLSVHESETSFNPEWDFYSLWFFNPQLNLPCKYELSLNCRSDWNSIRIHVNYPQDLASDNSSMDVGTQCKKKETLYYYNSTVKCSSQYKSWYHSVCFLIGESGH